MAYALPVATLTNFKSWSKKRSGLDGKVLLWKIMLKSSGGPNQSALLVVSIEHIMPSTETKGFSAFPDENMVK